MLFVGERAKKNFQIEKRYDDAICLTAEFGQKKQNHRKETQKNSSNHAITVRLDQLTNLHQPTDHATPNQSTAPHERFAIAFRPRHQCLTR